jgi:hypothetical protein
METDLRKQILEALNAYKDSISTPHNRLLELIKGGEPENGKERILKEQIDEIIKKGGIVDIPSM